jgi:Thiamine pyrophosphate enzyme, C-terminal TPP binding domain
MARGAADSETGREVTIAFRVVVWRRASRVASTLDAPGLRRHKGMEPNARPVTRGVHWRQRIGGRRCVEFGPIDFKAYAESFGAKGFAVESADSLHATLRAAMHVDGPAVVAIPADYSDNPKLMEPLRTDYLI